MVVDTELSDLFFNSHPETYDLLFKDGEDVTMEDIRQALMKDASEFILMYPISTVGYTADNLVEDFLHRF